MTRDAPAPADGFPSGFVPNPDAGLVQRLWSVIQQMAYYLDEEEYAAFLAFLSDDASYKITAFSAELRKEVAYLDLDRGGLETLLFGIDDHVRFPNKLIRHPGQPMVREIDGDRVACTTKLAIYHVDPHGAGGLYAVANYQDRFELMADAGLRLLARNVVLETRTLPFGSHIPL